MTFHFKGIHKEHTGNVSITILSHFMLIFREVADFQLSVDSLLEDNNHKSQVDTQDQARRLAEKVLYL